MTRKQERARRARQWLAIVAAGGVAGVLVGGWLSVGVVALALAVAHSRMIAPPGVAVLTYHSVADDTAWLPWAYEIAVTPATLERHLDTLAAMRCTVMPTRAYVAARERGAVLPPRAVLIHFDDGYLDNWVNAVPLLTARRMPATFFPSLDFIEPGDAPRRAPRDLSGYMNWAELAAIESHDGLEVEPHGIDHGRIPVSDRAVDRLTERNWRRHAWMQWRATEGTKHDWHRAPVPVAVPLGSPVPESGLALAVRGWRDGVRESVDELEARITRHLRTCREAFETHLGHAPQVFCWPENVVGAEGRRIASELGYRATTGGRRRNTADEPAAVISRIHMGDRALGFRWLAAEGLHLRAATRLAQGNLYWYAIVGPMNWTRAIVSRVRRAGGHQ